MHLLYHCINHFDYFIFLYADIYLISSARNKSIVLSSIKLFSSFALTPTQTGKTDDYIHEGTSIFILPVFPYLTQRVPLHTRTSMRALYPV